MLEQTESMHSACIKTTGLQFTASPRLATVTCLQDRMEQITRKNCGTSAHDSATAEELGEARLSFTVSLWKAITCGSCKPCEDRRHYCFKVMSDESSGEKEVDSDIHFDRAFSWEARRG